MEDPASLIEVGRYLEGERYSFVAVTPETHARVNARAERAGTARARTLRDVFGWNRPFDPDLLPPTVFRSLERAAALIPSADGVRSGVRFGTLGGRLFAHSSFPTVEKDAVFFGPDTYRFCSLLRRRAPSARRVIDIGSATGAGGLSVASRSGEVVLADINPRALAYAEVNAALAGANVISVESDVLAGIDGDFDLVISNPPYLSDAEGRVYRDGGGRHGEGIALRIVSESCQRLTPGGQLILYTGAAIVDGVDTFLAAARDVLEALGATFTYEELDPDVFGEELARPEYSEVDRIAAVALHATRG